jgi:serine/threonine protein kinase
VIKLLGTGAFGKVVLARHLATGNTFAIKVLDKKSMSEGDKINTWSERTVLNKVAHPFIAHLEFAFQSPTKLFMGMEFFAGGDLHHHIHHGRPGRRGLVAERARFYAAEVVAAIAHMHSLKVIYRDLKGENVMIDVAGHVKLVDFGLAKLQAATPRAAHSLVGSPFYVAPEVLESFQTKRGYGKACDWWSLGILIFEMLMGSTPFEAGSSRQQLYWNIAHAELRLPTSMDASCQDLLRGLLRRDPNLRLGSWSEVPYDIMHHPYFAAVDWDRLIAKDLGDGADGGLRVPWVPSPDASYVDREFAGVTRVDSLLKSKVTAPSSLPEAFEQFTFMGDNVLTDEQVHEKDRVLAAEAAEAVAEAEAEQAGEAIAQAAEKDRVRLAAAEAEMEVMGLAASAEDVGKALTAGGGGGGAAAASSSS